MDQPSTAPAASGPKTYVFVDEYNRHKRLKVMRACDGCRKRKIRCDGALQNGPWPCGACQRLKLKCIPPTLDQEDDQQIFDHVPNAAQFTFQNATPTSGNKINGLPPQPTMVHEWSASGAPLTAINTISPTSAPTQQDRSYASHMVSHHAGQRSSQGYSDDEYFASPTSHSHYQSNLPALPRPINTQTEAGNSPSDDPKEVDAAVREMSEQMGDLSVEIDSIAPYIVNEKKNLAETPAVEDADVHLLPSVSNDSTVRIPPEMMPSEERALDYFGYFFNYVHPYVPVLNRQAFYDQWRTARHSISPLILEGIFACVSCYLEDQVEVKRWLALASRHEESFKDVPRLSTIQAMIILTKARESIPRRGYYYRSWMAVKYMTTMAFDIGLQDHLDQHRGNKGCRLSISDCMIRTRVWQTLFLLEILVGAPQGRTDFAVELESVDFTVHPPAAGIDEFEYHTSRRTTYFTQDVRNIKHTNMLWQSMRRQKKEWALDPMFVRQNEVIKTWLSQLPPDMQIQYSDDDSPPWLGGNHHVAYLHAYHHLVVIMHHRPQIQTLLEKRDPNFKRHLEICNDSASTMCRLQEAVYRDFGLHGLQFMQRGIGFTIYAVLTCTMLHLATITSPDPITNTRARMYFKRHMRILEHCIPEASPEIRVQIDTLREAFSQDINQPFELKPSLGLRSPSLENHPTPPELQTGPPSASVQSSPQWSQFPGSSKNLTPATEYSQPFEQVQSHPQMPLQPSHFATPAQTIYTSAPVQHQVPSTMQQGYTLEPVISNDSVTPVWDPSGIFAQWNTAFGGQAAQPPPPAPPVVPDPRLQQPATSGLPQQQLPVVGQHSAFTPQQMPPNPESGVPEPLPGMPPAVTPVMWQDAFTRSYITGHGHKRYRDDALEHDPYYAKRRA